jgi:gliding motility-associated-like protein
VTGINDVSLTWTDYTGWSNGVLNYVVEKYSEQGNLIATIPVGAATSYVDTSVDPNKQTYIYVVKANAVDGGLGQAVSNEVKITKKPILKFPTAFTPDGLGDVRNELFVMACCPLYIKEFDLKIFNRWGELIFSTTNIDDGWDGTFRGNDQPEGTYAFVANIRDLAGQSYSRSGSVVLLRKK